MSRVRADVLAADGYIPVSVATLVPATTVGTGLYLRDSQSGQMTLYRGPEVELVADDLQKLLKRGQTKLYVSADDHSDYQRYLRDNLADVVSDETVRVEQRFASLNEVVRDVLATTFAGGNMDEAIEQCRDLAQHNVELICRNDVVGADLLGVMYHDYHTFTHSANVSYYCTMLAEELSITDADLLVEIATAGLLHDVGKLEIPEKILCKKGRLTDTEFEIIKSHPTVGFQKLCHREDLSLGQLMMVYQHHERLDGKGYPVGVTQGEIHDWARLCTVVDVFEALTSNRPYRAGLATSEAFQIMDRDAGCAFDPEMLQCWKAIIKNV